MLGICCHYLREETKPRSGKKHLVNEMEERTLQLGRYRAGKYTDAAMTATYVNNAKNLARMLPKIRATGIRLFRISSALFPLADQVQRELWDNDEVKMHLKAAGDYVLANDMRVTLHPGQFCVLSSDSDVVIENAFRELATHGWLFDAMGLDHSPKWAINIHGGKRGRAARLIEQIKSLPDNVRKRLTLENDEIAYNVTELLDVHKKTNIPLVWDSHHHTFNDGDMSIDDACEVTQHTWPEGVRPLQHISNTDPAAASGSFTERRKHSDMIHYVPNCQLRALRDDTIDVETEAKMKNIAVFKMAADFQINI